MTSSHGGNQRVPSADCLRISRRLSHRLRSLVFLTLVAALAPLAAGAQDAQDAPSGHDHMHDADSASAAWTWAADANVFAGDNYQQRHFADFSKWESQN